MEQSPKIVVGIYCLDRDQRICLVRTKRQPRFLTLPGGKVCFGETLVQCVRRELLEETGTAAQNARFLGWGEHIEVGNHLVYFDFRCETARPCTNPQNEDEVDEVVWLPLAVVTESAEVLPRTRLEVRMYLTA